MNAPAAMRRLLAVLAVATVVFAVFFTLVRPWYLRWGATDAELAVTRPGEELVPGAPERSTRAVTIMAPAEQVWPWLAQLGQDRGGLYSYEVLEDLAGCEMPRARQIMPEHQSWKFGEKLWMYPPDKLEGIGGARLVAYEPGKHLVFATRRLTTSMREPENGIWGFVVEPVDAGATRLVAYGRAASERAPLAAGFARGVFEPAHYVMERRMMQNVKSLAEGGEPSKQEELIEVALWTITLGLIVAALAGVARRRLWGRALGVAVLGALVFQVLTLLQPPVTWGAVLVTWLALSLWWGDRPLRFDVPGWTRRYSTRATLSPGEMV